MKVKEGGVMMIRTDMWTEEEDNIIAKYYPTEGAKGCKANGLNRSVAAIKVRANSKGIKRDRSSNAKLPLWSSGDKAILKKYFKTEGIKGVINRGVLKSPHTICLEAIKMGLYE